VLHEIDHKEEREILLKILKIPLFYGPGIIFKLNGYLTENVLFLQP